MGHSGRLHSLLSASGSSRWLSCPESLRAEEAAGGRGPTRWTLEGEAAHEAAERVLRRELRLVGGEIGGLFGAESEDLSYDIGLYIDAVTRLSQGAETVMIETRVDYSLWAPGGFGTADCIVYGGGVLSVVDLKYGVGVEVSAQRNSQLMLYGLGALRLFPMADRVVLTVVQPRLGHVDRWETDSAELLRWGDEVVSPAAAAALSGDGGRSAGTWCRFCSVRKSCLEFMRYEYEQESTNSGQT